MRTIFALFIFLFGSASLFAQNAAGDSAAKAKITYGNMPISKDNPQQVFTLVQQPAKFKEGNVSDWLASHIVYPATEAQGTVYVACIIETNGSVTNVKILRGVEKSLDAEALRVVASMPKWIPALQNGHAVRQLYNLPIKFKR
jgi:protein TonB